MNQDDYLAPDAVIAFRNDVDKLGVVNDQAGWYVTESWVEIFKTHLKALLPLAKGGDISAQYSVAVIYMCGYLHKSEEEMAANYESDQEQLSNWLEKAARGGHWGAIDNLLVLGVGDETDRLRRLYRENSALFEREPAPSAGWERDMKKLHELAYGGT